MEENVISLIANNSFAIAGCVAMGWYVKYVTDKHREDMRRIQDQNISETKEMTQAINNNTIVITKLIDKLEGGE